MQEGLVGVASSLSAVHTPCDKAPLAWRLKNLAMHRIPDMSRLAVAEAARLAGVPIVVSKLYAKHRTKDGKWTDYGVVSTRVVTTAGVGFLVDAWQNLVEIEIMRYHGVGTSITAEAIADTALGAESTTALLPDSTRATGSLTEGATANIFRTIGTVTFDATVAITEHGLFSQAATGGGVLFDRSVFSAINVVSGDAIQFTYEVTFTPGS